MQKKDKGKSQTTSLAHGAESLVWGHGQDQCNLGLREAGV